MMPDKAPTATESALTNDALAKRGGQSRLQVEVR